MLSFEVYVNDPTFDNDDNPYGKLIFHQFSNMQNMNDTEFKGKGFIDTEIPLIPCVNSENMDWQEGQTKHYCPDFKPDIHFIYGGFYGKQYSWLRMAVHQCDNSTKAEE